MAPIEAKAPFRSNPSTVVATVLLGLLLLGVVAMQF